MMSKSVRPLGKQKGKIAAMAFAACAVLAFGAQAFGVQAGERLEIARNNMVRVVLPASAGSVVVGNPNIADVNIVDSHTLFIIGRGFGSSAVSVVDRQGRTIFDGQVIVTAGQRDSVMVYKGAKASMMVCSRVCTTADDEATTAGQGSAAPAMVMSSAPTPSAPAAPGAAVALQQ